MPAAPSGGKKYSLHRACAKKPFFGTASAQCCYTPAENLKLARNFFRLRVIFLDYSVFGHTCPVFGTTYF